MADYGTFKLGNVTYPLSADISNSLLKDANPGIYYALDFFAAMLQTHMGDRFDAVVTDAGLLEYAGKVVAYQLPYDPMVAIKEQQVQFPLLAVWESESETSEKTFSWFQTKAIWNCTYSLPALTSAQTEQLYPFLKAARDIIIDRSEQGFDPTYGNKAEVWSDGYGGIDKIKVTKAKYANLVAEGSSIAHGNRQLCIPTLLLTFEVTYREEFNINSLETLGGVDAVQQLDEEDFLEQDITI